MVSALQLNAIAAAGVALARVDLATRACGGRRPIRRCGSSHVLLTCQKFIGISLCRVFHCASGAAS